MPANTIFQSKWHKKTGLFFTLLISTETRLIYHKPYLFTIL